MSIKPPSRPRASAEQIWEIVEAHRDLFPGGDPGPVIVVAVRGYYLDSMGARGRNDRGIYDDAKFILDSAGHFSAYNANTDPSIYKPGRAVLEAPQVVTYRPGWHGYNSAHGHPAFRQASDVIVIRDGGKGNGVPLGGGRYTDRGTSRFWINDHRGGRTTTSSAGCQTTPPDQWDAYYHTLKTLLKRHGVDRYNYLLVEDPRIA